MSGGTFPGVALRAVAVVVLAACIALSAASRAGAAPAAPSIKAPSNYSWSSDSSVTVAGLAAPGSTVELFLDWSSRGTVRASIFGTWSRTITIEDGDHVLLASASDATGTSYGSGVVVRVDTRAPSAPAITSPADGSSVGSSVTVTGTADSGTTVEILEDGQSRGTVGVYNGYWSREFTGLKLGSRLTFTARSTDFARNVSPLSAARTVTVGSPAPQAPQAPEIDAPDDNGWSRTSSVALSGTAAPGSTVTVREGTGSRGSTTASISGLWSLTLTDVSDGAHVYTATAANANGTSPPSASRTVRVDTVAPAAATLTSPVDDSLQGSTTVSVSGTAEPNSTVTVYEEATARGSVVASSGGAWDVTLSGVSDGAHTYAATVADPAGNTSVASASRSVRVDTTAPATPALTSPDTGAVLSTSTVSLAGTAEAGSTVTILEGSITRGTATTAGDGTWSVTVTAADGVRTYTATARDLAGNVSGLSAAWQLTVDTHPPEVLILSGPGAGSSDATFSFSADESDVTFTCSIDDAYSACTSPKSYTGLAAGDYTFRVRATDAAGNVTAGAATRDFTVEAPAPTPTPTPTATVAPDTEAPSVPQGMAWDGVTQSTVGLKWDAATDDRGVAGYRLYRNGVAVGTTHGLTYTFTDLDCATSYTFALEAYDAAGNASIRAEATGTTTTSACPAPTPTPSPTATPTPSPTAAPDTQAPSVPQGMAWSGVTQTTIGLRWDAATDDRGVAGYRLYRNGVAVGTTTALSYTFSNLTCGTTYTIALEAYDAAGNASHRAAATGTTGTGPCATETPTPAPTATATAVPTATATATPAPTQVPGSSGANLWVNTSAGSSPQRCATACDYSASQAYGSFAAAVRAASDGDVVRVKSGRYGPQGTVGGSSKTVTIIGEPGTTIDTGAGSGTYNHLNFDGNVTIESVDVEGDYPLVLFSGANNTWRKSTFHSARQIRRCDSNEPILIEGDNDNPADTIRNTTLQDIVIEQQRASMAGQGGCPSNDPFHLEMIRIGRNVDGVLMDRVTFGPCPNGPGFVGCGSGQIFITTTSGGAPPRNIVLRNSRFYGAVNYHVQTHANVGTSNVDWTFAYNTFGRQEPVVWGAPHGGLKLIGNLGTRPQNCSSNVTYVKNVWQWNGGTPCGTDKRVGGSIFSLDLLGLSLDLSLNLGSPAIDAAEAPGPSAYCTTQLGSVDANGRPRPVGAACDAGAVERQ